MVTTQCRALLPRWYSTYLDGRALWKSASLDGCAYYLLRDLSMTGNINITGKVGEKQLLSACSVRLSKSVQTTEPHPLDYST